MAANCCDHHIKDNAARRALFYRNIIVLAVATVLQIHPLEHIIWASAYANYIFVLISMGMAYVIFRDFNHLFDFSQLTTRFCMGTFVYVFFKFFLFLDYVQSLVLTATYVAICTVLSALINFIYRDPNGRTKPQSMQDRMNNFIEKVLSLNWTPKLDTIILFSVLSTWGTSVFIQFFIKSGELLLHDSLMQLGVYNLGRWLRSHWEHANVYHNHSLNKVTRSDGSKIPITSLRKGDIFSVDYQDGIGIPFDFSLHSGELSYESTSSEQKTVCSIKNQSFNAGTIVYSGKLVAQDDYRNITSIENVIAKSSHSEKGERGVRLFLLVLYGVGIFTSVATVAASGLVLGIKMLCLTLMVACPCVYIIIKPAIQNIIHKYSGKELNTPMNTPTLPLLHSRVHIVSDRTFTLWHPDRKNDQGDYIISEEAKEMIRRAVSKGYQFCVLSGHATQNWEAHLKKAREDLAQLGVNDVDRNVIFDGAFHGSHSEKWKKILNIKKYGTLEEPTGWLSRLSKRLWTIVHPCSVIMVGDDINDKRAMQYADVSILVGRAERNNVAHNDELLPYAHFITSKKGVESLDKLLLLCGNTSIVIRWMLFISMLVSSLLMSLVCGYLPWVGNFNPALFCLGTTAYCFSVTIISHSQFFDNFFMYAQEKSKSVSFGLLTQHLLESAKKLYERIFTVKSHTAQSKVKADDFNDKKNIPNSERSSIHRSHSLGQVYGI